MPKSSPPPAKDKAAQRQARQLELANRLPPVPSGGGAYVVDDHGTLVLQAGSTRLEPPMKEA